MALDYRQAAQEILDAIGGPGNVVSAAHCATRLRLVLADDAKVDQAAVDNAAGAKGNFKASGQLQVIYGTGTVNKVYDEFIALGHITAATKAEVKEAAAQQQTNPFMRAIKLLGDVFVPIIPAIVASGLLLGIMSALSFMDANGFIALDTNNAWYQILNLVSNTAFTFLQILIGFSAAKAFGANPYLGAVVGMLLINPGLQNANTVATEGVLQTYSVIPGLYSIEWTGYQGHVIPIVIACGILAFIEKRLHRVVPEAFDLFVTPLVSVAATAYVTTLAVGPIFVWAENAILGGIQFLLMLPLGLGSLIMGALYAPTVVTGIHQMYTTIDLGQIATYGITYWLPLASAANIGQAGAALAVALKTKDVKVRSLALPSSLSAFMGITEPAIFGVNLRFFKPFVAGCIGGGLGAMFASIVGLAAAGTGVTGIFGILLCLSQPVQYVIMFAIAGVVAFAISYMLYKDPEAAAPAEKPVVQASVSAPATDAANAAALSAAAADTAVATVTDAAPAMRAEVLLAPMTGAAIRMTEVPEPVFASEAMGTGAAVRPSEGKLYAPAAGTVTVLAETGHALGMTTDAGAEVLMHIGIDTVTLEGKPFAAHVKVGDHVDAGQLLMDVDLDAIRAAGLDPVTPVIVTNADAYATVAPHVGMAVRAGESLVELS
ncbi:PTS beta-glucoside transporter subunit IIBCA [Thermophilibacter provencensis]|uniref:Glucose PTS transporter subunit IIA n=1 Tax=Thermophilibacter provencensis TaxID=1852386 RepID=A0A921GHS2_9ACTN|nr:PTS transporter subunit IIBCA [Thermophilibacter provencensis]HJF46214.1 glucose PTS transporter subunit IIA [Thermophilibacter provencensis]